MTIPKVLLVEDDPDIRTLFRVALEKDGFAVREANDGLEAIGILQIEEFDAIVLDLAMPRIDGVSALDTFRVMRHGEQIPVITVTALDDPVVEQRTMEAGAAVFLRKPITPDKVVEAVRRHLKSPESQAPSPES